MLTKKQRLECYTYIYLCLLAELPAHLSMYYHFGDYVFKWKSAKRITASVTSNFTELMAQKPKHATGSSWWPANNISARLRAVERAIAMCEQAKR